MNTEIKPGLYKHFKGNNYMVEGTAIHSETNEVMVVYRALYGERLLFVRPLTMFLEEIERDGKKMPRFRPFDKHDHEEYTANMWGRFLAGLFYNHDDK